MYYIKWKKQLNCSKNLIMAPYFKGMDHDFCWDRLSQAVGFDSEHQAKTAIEDEPAWLLYIEIVFIHPLNFESRCFKDI